MVAEHLYENFLTWTYRESLIFNLRVQEQHKTRKSMSRGTIQNPTQSQDFHFVQVLFIQNHSFLFELIRVLSSAWMSFHTTGKQSDWLISNSFKFQNQELFTSNYLKFQPKIGMKMVK